MKKYISLFALPLFLIGFSVIFSSRIEHAQADVPVAPDNCPTGTMTLTYADGSTADTYIGQYAPVDPAQPIPRGIDPDVDQDVDRWERRNGFDKRGCPACNIPFNPITKAFAGYYTAASLVEVVKKEGGGGPFCHNASNGSIFEALSDQNCSRKHPGTQFAGFKVQVIHNNYMCGTPSPWTDG